MSTANPGGGLGEFCAVWDMTGYILLFTTVLILPAREKVIEFAIQGLLFDVGARGEAEEEMRVWLTEKRKPASRSPFRRFGF